MNKYKKLLSNSIVFGIGNFGSKLLLLILVPFYTYHLSTQEYGTADLISTTINMLLPIISLSIHEATLRFAVNESEKIQKKVLATSLICFVFSIIIFIVVISILTLFVKINYIIFLIFILIFQSLQNIFAQYLRGIGKVKLYAVNGLLLTLVLGISNIISLSVFDLGIKGYLSSIAIANIFSVIFMSLFIGKINFGNGFVDKRLLKNMVIYSIPLIPNAFMWWLMNASSRYFIAFFLGAVSNGLFAVASKIPSVLSMIQTIFFQAWQLSAIEEINSESKDHFYSSIFKWLSCIMIIATSCILVFLKAIVRLIIESSYYSSWEAVPFLLIGLIFSSYSSFYGTFYIAAKKTQGVLTTSIYGAVVSIIGNYIFIKYFGLVGAGISTALSFFIIWVLRVYQTRDIVKIYIPRLVLATSFLLLLSQVLILFYNLPKEYNLIVFSCLITIWSIEMYRDKGGFN